MSNRSYLFNDTIFEFTPEDFLKDFKEERRNYAKIFNDSSEFDENLLYELQKWNVISLVINDPYLLRLK